MLVTGVQDQPGLLNYAASRNNPAVGIGGAAGVQDIFNDPDKELQESINMSFDNQPAAR